MAYRATSAGFVAVLLAALLAVGSCSPPESRGCVPVDELRAGSGNFTILAQIINKAAAADPKYKPTLLALPDEFFREYVVGWEDLAETRANARAALQALDMAVGNVTLGADGNSSVDLSSLLQTCSQGPNTSSDLLPGVQLHEGAEPFNEFGVVSVADTCEAHLVVLSRVAAEDEDAAAIEQRGRRCYWRWYCYKYYWYGWRKKCYWQWYCG